MVSLKIDQNVNDNVIHVDFAAARQARDAAREVRMAA